MKVKDLVVFSQIQTHQFTCGVVPEIAAREHAIKIYDAFYELFKKSNIDLKQIDKIAVTKNPGLIGSLLIGLTSAEILGIFLQKKVIYVDHVYSHIISNWLDRDLSDFKYPILCLTVSGGHNDIYLIEKNKKNITFKKLGYTLDDAAGECFDKVAKMLDLGYPGGPLISKYAVDGDINAIKLPKAMINTHDFNFSFSGIKNACRLYIEKNYKLLLNKKNIKYLSDFCASFQHTIADIFLKKIDKAVKKFNVSEVHLAGGVSSNDYISNYIKMYCDKNKLSFKIPIKKIYSTDNGAMVAGFAIFDKLFNIKII